MSEALLPQPGGFEGFTPFPKALDADHRCSSKGPDLEVPRVDRRAAFPTRRPLVDADDNAVSSVRKGKIHSVEFFWDRDEALEAAGLQE